MNAYEKQIDLAWNTSDPDPIYVCNECEAEFDEFDEAEDCCLVDNYTDNYIPVGS